MPTFEDHLPYHAFGSRYLELREPYQRGTDVKVLQTLFNAFIYHSNPPEGPVGPPVGDEGVFGPDTRRAVRQWQEYFGLSVDGVVGPTTGDTFGQYAQAYDGPRFGSRDLGTGARGGDVVVAQNRLACFRYWACLGHPASGTYDTGTANAVRTFQRDMRNLGYTLPVDGKVGFQTFDMYWVHTYVGGRGLYEGRNGIDTLWLQSFLKANGNYAGALDGYFGARTKSAVEAFQGSRGLGVDGVVGPQTMYSIGRVYNRPAATWPS